MTAKICAEKGLSTIILEKQSFPRDKPCGGGVSNKALDLIGENLPEEIIESYVHGFKLYSKKMDCIELRSDNAVGITTTRSRFDSFLVDIAKEKSAEFRQNTKVVNVEITSNNVKCKLENGDEIEGKIVIGSDGAHGLIAKKTKIRERWDQNEIGICVESDLNLDPNYSKGFEENFLELFFLDIPHGYGWVFPKKNSISIGIGMKYDRNINHREVFKKFGSKISEIKALNFNVDNFKVHITPSGGFKRIISTDRALLVGDAAGFIDPLTGEGIYYALKSGKIAADACCYAIEKNLFNAKFFNKYYDQICETEFNRDLRISLKISSIFYKNTDFFLNSLKNYSGDSWADLATGKRNYRNIAYNFIPNYFLKKFIK